jgi:formiminotetrahydrofolate cyclodeaminase
MESPIWNSTLQDFCDHVARGERPIVGGVVAGAVSARVGLSLLAMTLEVTARRRNFEGNRDCLTELLRAVADESARMRDLADEDLAAYQLYRDAMKLDCGTRNAALRRIIQTPLEAARCATQGLDLCARAVPLIPPAVVSDLGGAAQLLVGAVRSILLSVDSNLRLHPDNDFHATAQEERHSLELQASHQAKKISEQVALVIGSRNA